MTTLGFCCASYHSLVNTTSEAASERKRTVTAN